MMKILSSITISLVMMYYSCGGTPPPPPPPPPVLHQVTISWQYPPEYTGFNLFRNSGTGFVLLATLGKVNTYVDKNVVVGSTYQYETQTICTMCTVQDSGMSTIVTAVIP